MSTVIFNSRLLDPKSETDCSGGVRIEKGKIVDFGEHLYEQPSNGEESIDAGGLCLAPGIIDLRVKTGEPGSEHRETLATAGDSAVAGGVTTMVVMPETEPAIDDMALVEFIARRGKATAKPKIHVAGALTKKLNGTELAEIGLMKEAGAVFFSNGDKPISNAAIMRKIMTYARSCDTAVSTRPIDPSLNLGVMNSGETAIGLGLSGSPPEGEWIQLYRDLALAETTNCNLVVDMISTEKSVDIIKQARQSNPNVFVTVAAYNLFFNELDIGDYLTYCKVQPPFRTEADREALISAVANGDINAVVSAHDPQPPESKRVPFEEAAFGAAGLETTLTTMLTLVANGYMSLLSALRPLTSGPASLIKSKSGYIANGVPADLILFNPDEPWFCKREDLSSRSHNSPFDGRTLTGKVKRTIVDGKTVFQRN